MTSAVVDTNVLASGLTYSGSVPDRLPRAWLAGRYELAIPEEILTELERTLRTSSGGAIRSLAYWKLPTGIATVSNVVAEYKLSQGLGQNPFAPYVGTK